MKNAEHKKHQLEADVLWNRRVSPGHYRMGIDCLHAFEAAVPGQFVMVRPRETAAPLLRRPFSIHRLIEKKDRITGFEILYKVIGSGTEKLARCRSGERIDVLGPLGKGFSVYRGNGDIFMAAGGIGVAPFVFLLQKLLRCRVEASRMTLFLGGRSRRDLLGMEDFEGLGIRVRTATDDGSAGVHGLVTVPLEAAIQAKLPGMVYACGPVPMLRAVAAICREHAVVCEISIETMMACGMGACLGCAVENRHTDRKFLHACIDGPVFDAQTVVL